MMVLRFVLILIAMVGGLSETVVGGQQFSTHVSAGPGGHRLAGCYQFFEKSGHRILAGQTRVPGEFERQQYLLMAVSGDHVHSKTIARIIRSIERNIQPVVLINDTFDRRQLLQDLDEFGVNPGNVIIVFVEHNSKWTRDFGPTSLISRRSVQLVDWLYCEERKLDDDCCICLSRLSNTRADFTPFELEGGNLLSNGEGLIVTSERFLFRNNEYDVGQLSFELSRQLNATDLVVLEPLVGEETQHVDMFSTFTSPDTIVVGSYDPQVDPVNAIILDRNAKLLSQVKTVGGPLKVFRIPMGSQKGNCWRTYTNCVFANGILLVPSYGEHDDSKAMRQVLKTYRSLLPGWKIITIDASSLIEEGGALRCACLNISRLNDPIVSTPEHEIPRLNFLQEEDEEPSIQSLDHSEVLFDWDLLDVTYLRAIN